PYIFHPVASASLDNGVLTAYPTPLSGDSGSPVGPVSLAFYDGSNPWAILVFNPLDKVHKYYLDAFGRTNQVIEVTSGGNFTSKLSYDQVSNLTNLTDSASNQFSSFFNDLGQKVAMADPDMGFWQYGLDVAGRLKVQTDAKTNVIRFDYTDPMGRLKTK